jgi:uncharacterized protein YndB with AHSA1/START domain
MLWKYFLKRKQKQKRKNLTPGNNMKDLGKISKNNDGFQVRFERIFKHDLETVWSAITDPKKLALWFTDIEMDFKEGGQIMIQLSDPEKTKSYGKILRIIKPKVFEYMWRRTGYLGVVPRRKKHKTCVNLQQTSGRIRRPCSCRLACAARSA